MLGKRINENAAIDANKKMKPNEDRSTDLIESVDYSAGISKYFTSQSSTLADQIIAFQDELNEELRRINFKVRDIKYVYNPLEYASELNTNYVRKFGNTTKKVLFVGMNPGPFGMCQTGVPFGDPHWVRGWLEIEGEVTPPVEQCPHRPILGLTSNKKEVSGDRLWSLFYRFCRTPENLFKNCFIFNYCPLMFMKATGGNVTPAEIRDVQIRAALENACNKFYMNVITILQPEIIVPIGIYMDKKTKDLLKSHDIHNIKIFRMPHPSPRVRDNTNWPEKAETFIAENNLLSYSRDAEYSC